MRGADKEIKDYQEIAAIMKKAIVCRISLVDGNCPYIVPVNFAVHENHLYFHSAMEGKKIDILRKNNKVCFEMDVSIEIIKDKDPCSWGMKYLSVIGFGQAFFIKKSNEKKKALDLLMEKYAGTDSFSYNETIFKKVLVIDVRIEKISGKKSHIS
jgi:nitroimidazol reductase NimA-like FMN-containing flavoprotein (pyridoxamine 5'-phosphate oxidase superfamily)